MLKDEWLDMVNSHIKTYIFMGLITLVSGLTLSYSYSALKKLTEENIKFDIQRNIIKSVGEDISSMTKDEILNNYSSNITEIILDKNLNTVDNVSFQQLAGYEDKRVARHILLTK